MNGNFRGFPQRIRIDACRNRWESYAAYPSILCQLKRILIAVRKQFRFTMPAAVPDRSDGMDDIFTGQIVSSCNLRLTGFTSIQCPALCQQLLSGSTMNGSVHATAAKKRIICCVHNRYHRVYPCDVALNCPDYSIAQFHSWPPLRCSIYLKPSSATVKCFSYFIFSSASRAQSVSWQGSYPKSLIRISLLCLFSLSLHSKHLHALCFIQACLSGDFRNLFFYHQLHNVIQAFFKRFRLLPVT